MIDLKCLYWAAGFLEGEGTFVISYSRGGKSLCPTTRAAQVQREPLERLETMFGSRIALRQPNGENRQPIHCWYTSASRAIAIMMTLYPLMSPRCKEQIGKAISLWRSKRSAGKYRSHCIRGHLLPFNKNSRNQRRCPQCIRFHNKQTWERRKKRDVQAIAPHQFIKDHHCKLCHKTYMHGWYLTHRKRQQIASLFS